ncbi:MAG: beta-N-acetylhexosaminidase [Muribaculaceae bacterium]|nr:beta-N-acetylhexosaminidase [Muribaculaceae bacterium]
MKAILHLLLLAVLSMLPCRMYGTVYRPVVLPTPDSVSTSGAMLRVPASVHITLLAPDSVTLPPLEFASQLAGLEIRGIKHKQQCPPLGAESYTLTLDRDSVTIQAADYRATVYALHTLSQLLHTSPSVPAHIFVTDSPRCTWRAFMLDSGRQFQPLDSIKKYIRMASMLKMNRFHWHLTEGLGWRAEIKALPRLTEVGAFVGHGPEQQGFYTQDDMRRVVDYGRRWGVEIVPEIDLPGHSEAALNAYPSFGCTGTIPAVPKQGFTDRIFCVGKDSTVNSLITVIDELCDVFPGEYFHLGGDEAPKGSWEKCPHCQARIDSLGLDGTHDLQLWLSALLAKHLAEKGRKAIFWGDAVYTPGTTPLPDNTVIQWWNYRSRGDLGVRRALERNMSVILSPNYYCYLNFPEQPWRGYGPERTFDLEKAYLHNPADSVLSTSDDRIMGISCTLWTDYELTADMLDSRLFPRVFALAELMWHSGAKSSMARFRADIDAIIPLFTAKGYRP